MKTEKLTYKQHEEIGEKLKEIRAFMINLAVEIPNRYGKSKRLSKAAVKSFRDIDALRNAIENQFFIDYPSEATTQIYYGTV